MGIQSPLLPSANDRVTVRCTELWAQLEQLRRVLGFLRRDIPIQQAKKKSPFQFCLHIYMEKLAQIFPSRNTNINVECFIAVWSQCAAHVALEELLIIWKDRFLEVILNV